MPPPARLRLWPTTDELARMARHPAAYAPTAAEVLTPPPVPLPTVPMGEAERVLMNAIIADPDADEPRLRYADWIEPTDPERAAFICAQIRSGGRHPPDAHGADAPRSEWLGPFLPFGARDVVFRRGFAEAMSLTGRAFVSLSDALFAATPLRQVRLIAVNFLLPELAACVSIRRLTRLDLRGNRIGDAGAKVLATSPHLDRLNELDLTDNDVSEVGLHAFAGVVKVVV
jgi:uncharacterized protein (TIGR02996 family)